MEEETILRHWLKMLPTYNISQYKWVCFGFMLMLLICEGAAIDPYIHHGFEVTMVGCQWVSAGNIRIGPKRV